MNRKLYQIGLGFLIAAMTAGVTPVKAEGADSGIVYTPVNGGAAVFETYLVLLSGNTQTPNVTFTYKISPAEKIDASKGMLQVYTGVGTPTIDPVSFDPGMKASDKIQELPESVTVQKSSDGKTTNKDAVTLKKNDNKKYVRKDVTVNFSNVSFKEPGVYRYIVTEQIPDYAGIAVYKDDKTPADATRVLDVYVEDNGKNDDGTGKLKIAGYVLHNGNEKSALKADGSGTVQKSAGFVNSYTAHSLAFMKVVSGNQASRDEYFKFTVTITGDHEGNKYPVNLDYAEADTRTNGINKESYHNPNELTVGKDGTVTQDFWLQNGQTISIDGIRDKSSYTVAEDKDVISKEGYTPSLNTMMAEDSKKKDGKPIALDESYRVTDDEITNNVWMMFTNTKNGVIPTGIIMSVAPYAVVVIAGAVGIIFFIRRKKNDED